MTKRFHNMDGDNDHGAGEEETESEDEEEADEKDHDHHLQLQEEEEEGLQKPDVEEDEEEEEEICVITTTTIEEDTDQVDGEATATGTGSQFIPAASSSSQSIMLISSSSNTNSSNVPVPVPAIDQTKQRTNSSRHSSKEEGGGGGGGIEEETKAEDFVKPKLEAKQIYVLMSKEYRISRNRRAEWFFNNVNKCINFPQDDFDDTSEDECEKEDRDNSRKQQANNKEKDHHHDNNGSTDFEVVSIIPLDPPPEWSFEDRHKYRYHVNPDTVITYLSRRYRIVFCLDISPSVASVDVQAGGVVFDNIFKALQTSLRGLLQPFEIPGSKRTFRPEIFLTVIAHTPFFTPVTDQVLIQGQILEKETCSDIIRNIFDRLNEIENKIALLVTKRVRQLSLSSEIDFNFHADSDDEDEIDGHEEESALHPSGNGSNADENEGISRPSNNAKYSSFCMSPDFGLLDLLRQALIALSLMPENSSAGLVILTDGVISVPDGRYLDIILSQLRYNTVSCSFIQLSSPFHPHLCHGVLPYADLMKFIASATFGAFLSEAPEINASDNKTMNVYHNAFLAWSFHKTLETEWFNPGPPPTVKPGEWSVRNKCFFSVRDMPIVKKQQYENILHVDHMKVMSCRLREGFTIKEVITSRDGLSEVTLMLPWKFLIHLEYKILINFYDDIRLEGVTMNSPSRVRCVVSLEGPYDFLHDVTCLAKKPFSSLYRQLMVNRFWATRKNLSESDRLLVHLNSFSSNPAYYSIPESLKNGMPLFYWGSSGSAATIPQLMSNELTYPQFTHFWKPVCLLDTTVWQKWMHTHRIGVILEHDYPLPKNLHLPNSTGRFNVIQCRQAIMALNTLLKNMSSFVLLENQSYVHLMFKNEEEKVPHSFCLIRVTSKPPHVVLRLAFLIGTPGHLRHRTVAQFREKIATLTFPQRVKDPPKWRVIMTTPVVAKAATTASPLVNKTAWSEMPCCVIVHKPVEKILIKYDKCPDDFRKRLLSREETSLYVPEGKSGMSRQSTFGFRPTYQAAPVGSTTSYQMLPEVFNTIARYLHHRRWIWWFPGGDLPPLSTKWASEILATVTKIRLQEGFRFAHSSAGITNMVLELPMKNTNSRKKSVTPMVLQFLVFPPASNLQNEFEDFDSFDANNSLYLVTECWAEPQCGRVAEENSENDTEDIPVVAKAYLDLDYSDIPKLIYETDHKCISLVGTFEYLVRICGYKETPFLICLNQQMSDRPIVEEHESIDVIPFEFDLRQILMRSGQIEILFSSFFQDLSLTFPNEWNSNVSFFFERANTILYQQWCCNIASFQDKEVQLSPEQHDAATRSVLQRKGMDEDLTEHCASFKANRRLKGKQIQWRCFVRSSTSTHVLLTLVPASLKDMKQLLLHIDLNVESLHKTKSSRYVDFLDSEASATSEVVMECPNQFGTAPTVSSNSSSSSPHLADHHLQNCRTCQNVSRKRVRAFSGGSECAPAVKKYLAAVQDEDGSSTSYSSHHPVQAPPVGVDQLKNALLHPQEESQSTRSQTFSEGTVSGKLAQFMRTKRSLSDNSGGTGGDEDQDNLCSDPNRCSQLNDYLNRSGTGISSTTDENIRYVPCRPPVIGSMAYCIFTYSCSLMSLTDHIVFKKHCREETIRDFRVSRSGIGVSWDDDEAAEDDDDESSSSGSIFPNGRSNSQESFSESSLQRLEAAEHESLLKAHCNNLRNTHLLAYIWSAYRSLLSGYSVHPCDMQVVIEKCTFTRVQFQLDNFLRYVCRHKKEILSVNADFQGEGREEENDRDGVNNVCKDVQSVHQFIKKRFRRLIARNFTPATENGHVLYYKITGSNALSDFSGLGGPVKCSSDLEDNLDSCSIVADSLCSAEEPYHMSSLHVPSDNEASDRSPGTTRATTHNDNAINDDQQSCAMTGASFPASSAAATQCVPLFCYLTCSFQNLEGEKDKDEDCKNPEKNHGVACMSLVDIPTCYHELSQEFLSSMAGRGVEGEVLRDAFVKTQIIMELTFLTCDSTSCEDDGSQRNGPKKDDSPSSGKSNESTTNVDLSSFKKRLSIKQCRAIDQIIKDIEWLMEDEITSFRGGGGGSLASNVDIDILQKICSHVELSLGKPGCQFQQLPLNFVEHSGERGFQSFLDRFNAVTLNEYTFQQVDLWWHLVTHRNQSTGEGEDSVALIPPFWIILRAQSPTSLQLYHHCRYDENDLTALQFSGHLRINIVDTISNLIRTINQDLLLQQLHDTRVCSSLLEAEDLQDLEEASSMADMMMMPPVSSQQQQPSKFADSESDLSLTLPVGNFCPGMFSCQVVWVTTFNLHSRLRSGGGKTAFARGIQTLRSTLTAFEVLNRKNMFVYRDSDGNVFYMRFYRGVDVLEGSSNSPSKLALDTSGGGGGDDYPDSELASLASDSSSVNRIMLKRTRNQDSESEKNSRDDAFDGILALKVHGIVPAGEEIKEKLVQSLRNKLDDAVLDILSVTLKRNPHCKLTPEDVHFLQEPRSRPDSIFRFRLTKFIVSGHLPAFSYYLHQNLLQFLSIPKYTSQKTKYHFQDYSRLQEECGGGGGESSLYLYNQSPGGGGTGNRGIAIVSMALVDKLGNIVKSPEWRQPQLATECDTTAFENMIESKEVECLESEDGVMVEFSMWKQGRINLDLLKGNVDLAIKQAGWDLIMEFKIITAQLTVNTCAEVVEDDGVFENFNDSSGSTDLDNKNPGVKSPDALPPEKRRRNSHLNPGTTRSNSTSGLVDDSDEPRIRSMSFTGVRKPTKETKDSAEQSRDRAPSPVTLISSRGGVSEGSRPKPFISRSQSNQMSLTRFETGDVGKLHSNYTFLLDTWLDNGTSLGAPSLRRITVPLNCRYPVKCIVAELEKIIGQVASDNTTRQFWQHGEVDFMTSASCGGSGGGSGGGVMSVGNRRDSCGDECTANNSEYSMLKRHEKELLALEDTEEADYPVKILNLFRRNEKFQPSYRGHVCYLVARNFAHWKSCLNGDAEFSVHSSHDFKNLYKYPPLLNENMEMDGSHGSIEKLSRANYAREFVLWSGCKQSKSSIPILIPRQRFLRAKVTCSEVDFVVYNWSKECCERLQEQVTHLSHWIQARASLLTSILFQKSGLFYSQPIVPENFASMPNSSNPFLSGDVDVKDLILNNPSTSKLERRNPVTGARIKPMAPASASMRPTQMWTDFYRNIPLRDLLAMPEPVGENPVDSHGKQLLHVLNIQESNKEPEPFFQYWLTRGPSASNVITTQVLESFTQTARTIHFCLTPIMFIPSWRAAVAQTRDCSTAGGIIRRHRGSSRRHFQPLHPGMTQLIGKTLAQQQLHPQLQPPSLLQAQRMRHGSEVSNASSLSLRNRSRSYHSGMAGLNLNVHHHPEVILEKELLDAPSAQSLQQQQLQQLLFKVKAEEPWHAVLCRTFLQEYMQYLQTLGFVPIHCKASPSGPNNNSPGPNGPNKRNSPNRTTGNNPNPTTLKSPVPTTDQAKIKVGGPPPNDSTGTNTPPGGGQTLGNNDGEGQEEDERMIHFLQRCLPGGIMVIEVGLIPPFLYCKIHALEAKRIFPSKNGKLPNNHSLQRKNAVQFVDECEKMKVLTHLHSFMYDFHLRAMYLYISGRQLLFKTGYHITTFLDDFITYYPKCPNFSRNAVHIGMVTLEEVNTPSQVLFNYILGHDKIYRMKVIRMSPLNSVLNPAISAIAEDSSSEYVLVHNMSRKVSYRSSDRGEDQVDAQQQSQDEFDLTLVIAHDYPTSSRDFVPDYQGLHVKYYIVLTSRRELYPKGDITTGEQYPGKMCPVQTPEPLCSRHLLQCSAFPGTSSSSTGGFSKLVPPPAPPPSYFDTFEGGHFHSSTSSSGNNRSPQNQFPESIREEKVKYMGYFSSHEQLMLKIIEEQRETMEQFIRQLITKAAVDCRRDLLWQRLLIGGRPQPQDSKAGKSRSVRTTHISSVPPSSVMKEDIISRETVGPLYYWDFNELLGLVQVVPLERLDSRLDELLRQPVTFYQTLIKVLMAGSSALPTTTATAPPVPGGSGSGGGGTGPSHYNYREFLSPDNQIHQLAIFTQDAHKSIIMVEVNIEQAKCDIFMVFKEGKKAEQQQQQQTGNLPPGELTDAVYSLVEKVVNACCYTTWTTLIS